jgi:molecular chaperone DnaK
LSDEEINRMVTDAEEHAAEDAKIRALIDKRNQAEQMIHATEKSITDLADQMDDAEKSEINSRLDELREAVKGEDTDAIETKLNSLSEVTAKLAEKAYAQQSTDGDAAEGAGSDTAANDASDDAVDAEFEEVKEDKAS